jgi:hypothetical protein
MKNKILFFLSVFNLVCIFLIYILSYMTNNNHYALSIDKFFIASSIAILILALILRNRKVIFISLLSILLSVGMNIFNISISYQEWIEREQPSIGNYYKNI